MLKDSIKIKKENSILKITLDRPKANAINIEMSEQLYQAFKDFEKDESLKVAIVTGSGNDFFSAGWDLKSEEPLDSEYSAGGFAGLTEMYDLKKPIIAAVNGMAVGGGFELALACDIILASSHAEFFLPEAMIGIIPDAGGVLRLPKYIPRKFAMDMMLTGRRLQAEEGVKYGLIKKVTSQSELLPEAYKIAEQLIEAAPLAIAAIKEVMNHTEHLSVKEGFELMRSGKLKTYNNMLQSEDALEGPRAFAQKRAPVWKEK